MSDSDSYLERLRADLQRPAGGLTVGFVTCVMAPIGGLLIAVTGPVWLGGVWMAFWMAANIGWGMHGYYPRRV